jgi:soluble lytic murein transglycosylase
MRKLPRRLPILLFVLLVMPPAVTAAANDDARLPAVRDAIQAAEQGRLDPLALRYLADHPLASWIEYAQLKHDLAGARPDQTLAPQIRTYLARYVGQPPTKLLREAWLQQLDRHQDWSNYRAFYAGSDNAALRCADLAARLATGAVDAAWDTDAIALWRTGNALPADCDAPFQTLANRGKLTPELRWQRIELAADAGNSAVMRTAARGGLTPAENTLATDFATFIDLPSDTSLAWPKTDRSRRIAADGLVRLARRDPDAAERQLARTSRALQFEEHDRGRVLYEIALWTVASYLPGAAQRLATVPASAYDERLHEWQVREAMARGDDAGALKAIDAMDPPQRNDPRWQYFAARLHERRGDHAGATALYVLAARTATFHGFLAADRLNAPYALCPRELQPARADSARIASDPALVRALELFKIDRIAWAEREWKQALAGFNDDERRIAVTLAQDAGWYDRAVFALGQAADGKSAADELRLYTLRFPLNHARDVKDAARRNALDPAWLAAEIRAESSWMSHARSAADARGLMQLLPSTGARMANALGMRWSGGETLFDPLSNIAYGAAYLRQMLDRFGGRTYLAIGAYNAGTAPVERWLAQRPQLDPDFWIETVAWKETREYIARVLAFSVIYDWRLDARATPVSERMLGRSVADAQRRRFVCPGDSNTAATTTDGASP